MRWTTAAPFHTNWISVCGSLSLCLSAIFLKYLETNEDVGLTDLFNEDGWVENLTAVWLFLGGVFLFAVALMERKVFQRLVYVAGGVALIYGAGEEISWGQRIFGWRTPDILAEINSQGELTLHNTFLHGIHYQVLRYGPLLLCIISLSAFLCGKERVFGILPPPIPLAASFVVGLTYLTHDFPVNYFFEGMGTILSFLIIITLLSRQYEIFFIIATVMISVLSLLIVNWGNIFSVRLGPQAEGMELLVTFGWFWYSLALLLAQAAALHRRRSRFMVGDLGEEGSAKKLVFQWETLLVQRVQLSYLISSCSLVICVNLVCLGLAYRNIDAKIKNIGLNDTLKVIKVGEPIIRSHFDVYITESEIIYFRKFCRWEDIAHSFFLHAVYAHNGIPDSYLFFDFREKGGVVYRFRQSGKICLMRMALPKYEVAQIRTGQWALWEGTASSDISNYEAIYSTIVSENPHVHSDFDIYLSGGVLIYTKEPCVPSDTEASFFLHLYPDDEQNLPFWSRLYGFDNHDFSFSDRGRVFDDKCMAVVSLPSYNISKIVSGQYTPEARLWEVEFPFHDVNNFPEGIISDETWR